MGPGYPSLSLPCHKPRQCLFLVWWLSAKGAELPAVLDPHAATATCASKMHPPLLLSLYPITGVRGQIVLQSNYNYIAISNSQGFTTAGSFQVVLLCQGCQSFHICGWNAKEKQGSSSCSKPNPLSCNYLTLYLKINPTHSGLSPFAVAWVSLCCCHQWCLGFLPRSRWNWSMLKSVISVRKNSI